MASNLLDDTISKSSLENNKVYIFGRSADLEVRYPDAKRQQTNGLTHKHDMKVEATHAVDKARKEAGGLANEFH